MLFLWESLTQVNLPLLLEPQLLSMPCLIIILEFKESESIHSSMFIALLNFKESGSYYALMDVAKYTNGLGIAFMLI